MGTFPGRPSWVAGRYYLSRKIERTASSPSLQSYLAMVPTTCSAEKATRDSQYLPQPVGRANNWSLATHGCFFHFSQLHRGKLCSSLD